MQALQGVIPPDDQGTVSFYFNAQEPSVVRQGRANVALLAFYCETYLIMWLANKAKQIGPENAVRLLIRILAYLGFQGQEHEFWFRHISLLCLGSGYEETRALYLCTAVLSAGPE